MIAINIGLKTSNDLYTCFRRKTNQMCDVCMCACGNVCVTYALMVLMHVNVIIHSACDLGFLYKLHFVCLILASYVDIAYFEIQKFM